MNPPDLNFIQINELNIFLSSLSVKIFVLSNDSSLCHSGVMVKLFKLLNRFFIVLKYIYFFLFLNDHHGIYRHDINGNIDLFFIFILFTSCLLSVVFDWKSCHIGLNDCQVIELYVIFVPSFNYQHRLLNDFLSFQSSSIFYIIKLCVLLIKAYTWWLLNLFLIFSHFISF